MRALGRHLLIELYECDSGILEDIRAVEDALVSAAKTAKAHIVDVVFHTFNPHGVSGVVMIQESHLTIHTWPEYRFASVDIYTCGNKTNPWKAYQFLKKKFGAKKHTCLDLNRGVLKKTLK